MLFGRKLNCWRARASLRFLFLNIFTHKRAHLNSAQQTREKNMELNSEKMSEFLGIIFIKISNTTPFNTITYTYTAENGIDDEMK